MKFGQFVNWLHALVGQPKLYTDEPEHPNYNPVCVKCGSDSLFNGDTEIRGERQYKCCNCQCVFHTRST